MRHSTIRHAATFALIALLAGCTGTTGTRDAAPSGPYVGPAATTTPAPVAMQANTPYVSPAGAPQMAATLRAPVKVAILLPLTGTHAQVGESLLQAAQQAVFDLNEPNFQLVPRDTLGTREGAAQATDAAARDGAQLILGPLLSQEVEGARDASRNYGLNIIGFSTDWRLTGNNIYTMGVLPQQQAARMAGYAAKAGLRTVAVIASQDAYGDTVANAFAQEATRLGLTVTKRLAVPGNGQGADGVIAQLAPQAQQLNGVFIPLAGPALASVTASLKAQGIGCTRIRCMGTGIWDGTDALRSPDLGNAWYAAPNPDLRADFERKYVSTYGQTPPRLASLGYDAAALAVVLARQAATQNARVTFDRAALTNPNGFAGVDGIFRFSGNGLIERGMAILEVNSGSARVLDPAPVSFQ